MSNPLFEKKFMLNLLKEVSGYENGTLRTTIDLVRRPSVLLTAQEPSVYVGPLRYLMIMIAYYILVNSFLVDWDEVANRHMAEYVLITGNKEDMQYAKFFSLFMGTYLTPYVLLMSFGQLIIVERKTNHLPYKTEDYAAAVFYMGGINTLFTLVYSIIFITCDFKWTAIILGGTTVFYLLGAKRLFELITIDRFFPEHGKEVKKIYNRATIIVIIITSLIIGILAVTVYR